MRRLLFAVLCCLAPIVAYAAGDLLPAGYLSVSGNQIIGGNGQNVRLACIGYNEPTGNYASDMSLIRNFGFNCARYPYYDKNLNLTTMDQIVSAASAAGIRIIFDHHGNEADNACLSQQSNGLWYDQNAGTYTGTDNTDGCGTTGTITYATFKANWVNIATHYAGNSTVIGFDLHNEPNTYGNGQNPAVNWGGGGANDMQAMCQDIGNAIHGVNAGALIICEGPIKSGGVLFSGTSFSLNNIMDLSLAQSRPVNIPGKVLYSIHDYPSSISGTSPDSGTARTGAMNAAWGYLETNNVAPVFIGEMGASLDNSNGALTAEQTWASMITNYANGLSGAAGGPVFSGTQQAMSTDWWTFGYLPGQVPDGIMNADNTAKSGQQAYWSTLLYHASGTVAGTTWNPSDAANMTLSGSNLVATSSVTSYPYITPGNGTFTDGSGNTYSIDSNKNFLKNNVAVPNGAGTGAAEFYGGQVYAQDASSGAWFIFDGTSNFNPATAPPTPTGNAGVRTTSGKSSGKFCVAIVETQPTNHASVVIASAAEALTGYPGDGSSVAIYGDFTGQPISANGVNVAQNGNIPNLNTGDTVTVVVDATNQLVWFSTPEMVAGNAAWNHSATASPTNGTGGISISYITPPYYVMASAQESGAVFTLNPSPSNCPAGVPTWDTVVANGGRPMTVILGQNYVGGILLPTEFRFSIN